MSIDQFRLAKKQQSKISMVTCYDYSFAVLISESDIDAVLVGDSAAMTMHGHKSTVPATLGMIRFHVEAVARGLEGKKFLIADLPFLSFRGSEDRALESVLTLMQAGAEAVKLEGADGNLDLIGKLVQSGVPVMGHLGLTPQFVHQFGGFKVQGRNDEGAKKIFEEARALQSAGCFSIVLECVPAELAKSITEELSIPTVGIGAGPDTDGQVLVLQDLLGLTKGFRPKFVRRYMQGDELVQNALNAFSQDVRNKTFPATEESYK